MLCTLASAGRLTTTGTGDILNLVKIYERNNQKTAIQFTKYVLSWLTFRSQVIQIDNGAEFQAQFHWHVIDKGVNHVDIQLKRPGLNGEVGHSHRVDNRVRCVYHWC